MTNLKVYIKDISNQLNLSLSDFIFLDDTKHERCEVSNAIPELSVPELSCDQFGWLEILMNDLRFKKTVINYPKKKFESYTNISKRNSGNY